MEERIFKQSRYNLANAVAVCHTDEDLLAVVAHAGLEDRFRRIFGDGPTLEEASEDDVERLKKMSIKAMESGMNPANPNAQMVRAFHAWLETREGERQLEGIEIHVTPKSVPDEMQPMLYEKMKELTEIATRN